MTNTETATKSAAQKRKGRLFRQIQMGLSWHSDVQIQVPAQLWALVGNGWPYALVKSTRGIQDPDYPGVTWDAWMFELGVKYVRSSVAPNTFVNLMLIAQEARANPADSPTVGI